MTYKLTTKSKPQTRHSRQHKAISLTLSKEEAKGWTAWLKYKNIPYKLIKQ